MQRIANPRQSARARPARRRRGEMEPPPPIPRCVLVVAAGFGARLPARAAAAALARGLLAGGVAATRCWPIDSAARLALPELEARLRLARAVVIAQRRLAERTLQASPAFQIATRARQAGVPAYAVAAENRLSAFDARMLDLQLILEAATPRALAAAGRELAQVL